MTTREPEYSARDQALILADWQEQNVLRGDHGIPMSEATDPDLALQWEIGTRRDYVQKQINLARDAHQKLYKHDDMGSLIFVPRRKKSQDIDE